MFLIQNIFNKLADRKYYSAFFIPIYFRMLCSWYSTSEGNKLLCSPLQFHRWDLLNSSAEELGMSALLVAVYDSHESKAADFHCISLSVIFFLIDREGAKNCTSV